MFLFHMSKKESPMKFYRVIASQASNADVTAEEQDDDEAAVSVSDEVSSARATRAACHKCKGRWAAAAATAAVVEEFSMLLLLLLL